MIMIVWVNRRVYYEHYLVRKKKETLRLLWKLLGTQKRKLKTLWTLWFTKKVPPQDYELTWYTKKLFSRRYEVTWSTQKKFLRKVRSYFVNLLQNNDLLCFFFVPEIFLANILLRFCLLSGVLVVLWWTRNDSSKVIGNCNGLHKILWWLNYPLWSYLLLWIWP